jgi:hypothetical protein
MDEKYLVFTGNEYGTDLRLGDNGFLSLQEAEERFEKYYEEYGVAEMWRVGNTCLEEIKVKHDFE